MKQGMGRLIEFDEKSKEYPIRTLVKAKERRSYTWRCNKTLDQGPSGACVGFGLAHELISRPAEVKDIGYRDAIALYHAAQREDMWPGGAYEGAVEFYEGTSVLAGMKVGKKLGWYEEFRWAFSFEDVILGVGYNGPAVIGVSWHDSMFEPDQFGYIRPTGTPAGGHCVLVRAVNVRHKFFTIRNSWGEDWGINGDCYITFNDLNALLYNGGEAAFAIHRHGEKK